jgi:Uma2 family endonuclease
VNVTQVVIAPTTVISDRTWTVEEVSRSALQGRCELVEGILYMVAMPNWPHADIVDNLYQILGPWVRSRRLGRVYPPQTGIYLNETNYVDPDLMYVRSEDIPTRRKQRVRTAALAVEVLSQSNFRAPREQREELFRQAGIEELWYVDYDARSIEVRRITPTGYEISATYQGEDAVSTPVLPGLEFPLTAAWEDIREE